MIIEPGTIIGHLTVTHRVPNPNVASGETKWECLCAKCDCYSTHNAHTLRVWEGKLRNNPDLFIACPPCMKANRDKLAPKRASEVVKKIGDHKVKAAETYLKPRKAIIVCDACCDLPWQRRVAVNGFFGDCYRCKKPWEAETMPTALDFARVGSAAQQCREAVGYAHFSGTSGGRTR
ncbi:MAG TPA: hypothetical protein VHO25_13225 [Polyangiaceae bacterium]|nr:hypothetical protein [Polyangiaceae bacterium]